MAGHGYGRKAAMEHAPKEHEPAPKELDHIKLTPAENGGVVAEHNFKSFEHKPEAHVFAAGEGPELAAHIGEHMGMENMSPTEEQTEEEE
jgi:hypothetical protein